MILYHGNKETVEYPEIRKAMFHKDFYFGFYCIKIPGRLYDGQPVMGKKAI